MYDKFLDKSLNSTRQTIDDTFIAKYANAVSEQIIYGAQNETYIED